MKYIVDVPYRVGRAGCVEHIDAMGHVAEISCPPSQPLRPAPARAAKLPGGRA